MKILAVLGLWVIAGCGSQSASWQEALGSAKPGDTIEIPSGTYQGALSLPAGVTLQADGDVTLEADGDGALLTILTDKATSMPTRLVGLTLRSATNVALLATGDGELVGEDLDVHCQRGIGLAAEGLPLLTLRRSALRGDVTDDRVAELVFPATGTNAAVIGLALASVGQATLEDLTIERFGGFGAVLVDSTVTWTGGAVENNVGVAVIQDGGQLDAKQLTIKNTVAGQRGSAILAYGLVLTNGTRATTNELAIEDNSGYGIVQDNVQATHNDLILRRNGDVGAWIQNSVGTGALQIKGSSKIVGNRGAGVILIDSANIEIDGAVIDDTVEKKVPGAGDLALTAMADGLQVSGLKGDLALNDVQLSDNDRVGILLSGAMPAQAKVTLQNVMIDGVGRYGMVAEDGAKAASEWEVSRTETLATADASLTTTLGAAARIQGLPQVTLIRQHGLVSEKGLLKPNGQDTGKYSVAVRGLTPEND